MKERVVEKDREYVWHPFTPFDSWLSPEYEVLSIVGGKGVYLYDQKGREYLDGNSSIWTNLHGHRNRVIDKAIRRQLGKVAHTSFLGLTNELAPELAERILRRANEGGGGLSRVIFSDDGSTAIEAALKVVFQGHQLAGREKRTKFVSVGGGYHGDTVGAMSVGQSRLFHGSYGPMLFPTKAAEIPYCYRCPYNQAKAQEGDAREYRKCGWECVKNFREVVRSASEELAGVVLEPLVQGAAGMVMHPEGYLKQVVEEVKEAGGVVIFDEVMTGFYRTGKMFAHFHEGVQPDVLAVAKGLTGGYLPLALTMVSEAVVEPFYGGVEQTFYHGHSYSGNQLGCAAALANLELLEKPRFLVNLEKRVGEMRELSKVFWKHSKVGDVRQSGLILGVELVRERLTREAFDWRERVGWQVSEAAREYGLLTRAAGNVLVLMPPLNVRAGELRRMVECLEAALYRVFPEK